MHVTTKVLDWWSKGAEPGIHVVMLAEGDTLSWNSNPRIDNTIEGPAVVELVRYRDGGWSARALKHETPESLALRATLRQHEAGQ